MERESKIQSRIRRHLEKHGWWVTKLVITSKPGTPDLVAVKGGRTVWLEIKREGKKPYELQLYVHEQIRNHGGEVYWTDSFENFLTLPL